MKKILAPLLVALWCTSCYPSKKAAADTMNSWIGHKKPELIQSWGPPTRTESDGSGGEILVYEQATTSQAPGVVVGRYYTAPTLQTTVWYRQLYVRPDGTIYHARWNY